MKNAALKYARAGWRVFPVNLGNDKKPYIGNWPTRATTDEQTVEEWWSRWPEAAIGTIPFSAGLLCLDYDTKHGVSLSALQEATEKYVCSTLPITDAIVRTPSGGEHHYFSVDEEVPSSNGRLHKNVDVRCSENGYVVLPPSPGYKWIKSGSPAKLPRDICGKLNISIGSQDREWLIKPDLPEHVTLALGWMRSDECRPSIEGQGGNQALYDTAAMMISYGLSEEKATELISTVYNHEKCEPPWDHNDIERTIGNAYRYHTSTPGNRTPALRVEQMGFAPLVEPPKDGVVYEAKSESRFRITDRDQIIDLPPPSWLLDKYIPQEANVIFTGQYGTYKSFIALDMALTVATGSKKSAWSPHGKGSAIYMLGEGRPGMGKRLAAWEKHHNLVVPRRNILFVDPVPHVSLSQQVLETELVEQLGDQDFKLVVLDTMGRAIAGLNENASEVASSLSAICNWLRERLQATVLVIAHTPKDGTSKTRGSGVFENDADTVLNVERVADLRVSISNPKQKDAPEAEPFELALMEKHKSLVVVPTAAPPKERARTKTKAEKQEATPLAPRSGDLNALIDTVAEDVLANSPHNRWSLSNLAENIAKDNRVEVKFETIKKRLKHMAMSERWYVGQAYLPPVGRGRAAFKWVKGE